MRIEAMRATFGKLKTETLTVTPGLNILQMPNEMGKSTWCAFLLSMLYGVDTAERESRGNFPVKKHFAPWSGSAMEGFLQLEHGGRRITIERRSTARSPLGVFRAYDTASGQDIPELNAQNCGQTLLGVPRQVFVRSAFLRQDGAAIQMEDTLEQRLGALVSTGEERISYQQAERTLRERRNRCRHNHTGLIPQTQAKLDDITERLTRLEGLHEVLTKAKADEQRLLGSLRLQKMQLSSLQAKQAEERRVQLTQVSAEAAEKMDAARALERDCADLPPMEILQGWERDLSGLEARQHTLALDIASLPQPEAPPAMPKPFVGLDSEGIKQRANVDAAQMRLMGKEKKPSPLWWSITAGLLAAAGAVCAVYALPVPMWIAFALAAVVAIAGFSGFAARKKAWAQTRETLERLYDDYGVAGPDELDELTERCRERYSRWDTDRDKLSQELDALRKDQAGLDRECEALLARIRPLAGTGLAMSTAPAKVREAISRRLECESAMRSAEQVYRHYLSLKEAIGNVPAQRAPEIEIPSGKTITSLQSDIFTDERTLQQVRSTIDRGEGQCITLGDPMELHARKQALTEKLAALELEYDALATALTAIGKANEHLQKQFSPQLTALAADYLSRLTGGAYTALVLERDLSASLYAADAPASREAAYFSGGTKDQLYLSVRLAVSRLLAPGVPLILDDALVRFDDSRLLSALKLLQDEAKDRQILLFTCQGRENAALQTLA